MTFRGDSVGTAGRASALLTLPTTLAAQTVRGPLWAPLRYFESFDPDACGVVLIWTRR